MNRPLSEQRRDHLQSWTVQLQTIQQTRWNLAIMSQMLCRQDDHASCSSHSDSVEVGVTMSKALNYVNPLVLYFVLGSDVHGSKGMCLVYMDSGTGLEQTTNKGTHVIVDYCGEKSGAFWLMASLVGSRLA